MGSWPGAKKSATFLSAPILTQLLIVNDFIKSSLNMDAEWPTFTITADSPRDALIMGDLVILWQTIIKIANQDQLKKALQTLQAAQRRGDVQYADVCEMFAMPDGE